MFYGITLVGPYCVTDVFVICSKSTLQFVSVKRQETSSNIILILLYMFGILNILKLIKLDTILMKKKLNGRQ